MIPIILYRNDVDWRQESSVVEKYFRCIPTRMFAEPNQLVISRFSALPFYKEIQDDLEWNGAKMINSYHQHRYIADLWTWYQDLSEFTPKTWSELYKIPNNGPFVLKGETNSKKFLWGTHFFAADKCQAIEVYSRLISDSILQYQNIYIREYVPLEHLASGLQGLPISREYRFFVYKKVILSGGFYWSSHTDEIVEKGIDLDPNEVPRDFLNSVINKIQSTEFGTPPTYYVIDVAKTREGEWIVIELNDAQLSGLSDNNPETLYSNLQAALAKDGHVDAELNSQN